MVMTRSGNSTPRPACRLHHPRGAPPSPSSGYTGGRMAGHSTRGVLGRLLHSAGRLPGPFGRLDAASPDATAVGTGDTPGTLGRSDWASPDHPAFHTGVRTPPGHGLFNFDLHNFSELIFGRHAPPP